MKWENVLKFIIGSVVVVVMFYFIFKQLAFGWTSIKEQLKSANWFQAFAGIIVIALSLMISASVWRKLLKSFYGTDVSWGQALILINLPNLARYIPGKIWFVFGIAHIAKKWSIDVRNAIVIAFVNQIIALVAAMALGVILIGAEGARIFPWWALLITFSVSILFLHPALLHRMVSFALRKKGQERSIMPKMNFSTIIAGLALMILLWLGIGAGLLISSKSILASVQWADYQSITGAFVISYVGAYIAFFAPGELGVREGLIMLLLPDSASGPEKAALSIATRIWMTVAELINVVVAIIVFRKYGSANKNDQLDSTTEY